MIRRLALLLFLSACVHAGQKTHEVRQVIKIARDQGAYVCAPVELAKAESHADFADAEFIAGNAWAAAHELSIAHENAQHAIDHSPREKCSPSTIVRKDSDHDGVADEEDRCPNEPEDRDDFMDDDGCPDPDNDQDGILDADDKCPNDAGPKENNGCPDQDQDGDGVIDRLDKCPEVAGVKENDGCPDADSDGDGVIDRIDRCPDVPGVAENAGCPAQKFIVVTKAKIELKEKVHFATAESKILPDSFAMLNEVAEALKQRPEVKVRIEGHTDSRGSSRKNLALSQRRADSVRQYLIAREVPADQMEARGYGQTQEIADNRTAVGREQNRRVEFIIIKQ